MLGTGYVVAMLGLLEPAETGIVCDFPGEPHQKPIQITLEPQPSLKDQPGLFRVMMDVGGKMTIRGAAQPLLTTRERDVLVMGRTQGDAVFTIGLRDDGRAALNMRLGADTEAQTQGTRAGRCKGAEPHFLRWLPS